MKKILYKPALIIVAILFAIIQYLYDRTCYFYDGFGIAGLLSDQDVDSERWYSMVFIDHIFSNHLIQLGAYLLIYLLAHLGLKKGKIYNYDFLEILIILWGLLFFCFGISVFRFAPSFYLIDIGMFFIQISVCLLSILIFLKMWYHLKTNKD
jgi:hypothetical protein